MTDPAAVARGLVPRNSAAPSTAGSHNPSHGPQLIHALDRHVDLLYGDTRLFRYVYCPDTPRLESPKPYFHPVRTLAGNKVTVFRPHDHVWHKGIAMTWAQLSGQNFWGGPTYVRDKGYVQLPNNGRMAHQSWSEMRTPPLQNLERGPGGEVSLTEHLSWITESNEPWLAETRTISVPEINPTEGYWTLDFDFTLRNTRGQPLVFGSPTTEGRPMAGYGGLFWRGPRSFLNGTIFAAGGLSGPDVMGQSAPWLAFTGKHDGSGAASTVALLDHPTNPRYPTKWFVRNTPYACASFAFAFDEELTLPADSSVRFRYRILIADGPLTPDHFDAHHAAYAAG